MEASSVEVKEMPRKKKPGNMTPSSPPGQGGGGYTGPPVMGPGQGILPLPDPGSDADDFFGPFGTGHRGTGPSPPVGTGPFDQTFDDLGNLWEYGTTTPHWSEAQMLKAYGMNPFRAIFNKDEAERSVTSAEIDRIFRNVSGGLGHYTGSMIPGLFGGGDGPVAGGQWSVPPRTRGPGGTLGGQYPPDTSVPGGTHTIGPGHPAFPYPPGDAGPPPRGINQEAFDKFNMGDAFDQAEESESPANPWPNRMKNRKWRLLRKLGFGPKLPKQPGGMRGGPQQPQPPPEGLSDLF